MEIHVLDKNLYPTFEEYIHKRIEDCFYIWVDWITYPESTQIWLALNENFQIQGLCMIFKEKILSLRGNLVAIEALAAYIHETMNFKFKDILIPHLARNLVMKLKNPSMNELGQYRMVITLKEFTQKHNQHFTPTYLDPSDAGVIAELFALADPIHWGNYSASNVPFESNHEWIGIFHNKRLISVTGIWYSDLTSLITMVATHPEHQRQGHASNLLSLALSKIFLRNSTATINLRPDNTPAIHVYEKLGFKKKYHYTIYR